MRPLADTIKRLARMREAGKWTRSAPAASRLARLSAFGSNPGSLNAWTYSPAGLADDAPLVVVLHGCRQTAAEYDFGSGWSLLADRHRFALLFPEQQRANNGYLCFNWFLPEDTRRDAGEALSIRQMIATLTAGRRIDRRRVFITGLSAGGAMASVMLAAYPEVFAAGAILAGLPYGSASTVPEAFDRMRGQGGPSEAELVARARGASEHDGAWPRISVWQGSADQTVVPSNADAIVGQWRALHGLPRQPTRTDAGTNHHRQVWCDHQGRELIEHYSIAGMGHGAAVHRDGIDGSDSSGAFMLDAGISSTRRTAAFWGVAPDDAAPAAFAGAAFRHDDDPAPAAPSSAATRIGGLIDKALRAAGLIK
jgi:poly(hydroxyalkanoate) depolymerase family esterase